MADSDDLELKRLDQELAAGRARHRRRGPRKVATAVANVMARRGYGRLQSSDEYVVAWRRAVGDSLAAVSRPGALKAGVLEVLVANSVALQELTFQKHLLLTELTRQLPGHQLKGLRFRVVAFEK